MKELGIVDGAGRDRLDVETASPAVAGRLDAVAIVSIGPRSVGLTRKDAVALRDWLIEATS